MQLSDVISTLALSVVLGVAAAIGFFWVGNIGANGSIFLGILVTIVLGVFLHWTLFRPLPKIENGRLVKDD